MDIKTEVQILQDNIKELQKQLAQAHQRIGELVSEKSASNEEVVKQKQFIQEITGELKRVNSEAEQKIQQQMDEVPDVMDSKQILKG
jgi:predicted  nucleic acid-binding Zn-ribbon protein